ncbi:vacuolar protein sorting-associated protein 16 [Aulographum hederae CBS 113979]|uniref:Probable vacuolar protein sorting-associated protein 16 homolog n=1 Tax=Aulographum hederae CBS 113979 TaxID=1176131 RepID=A0A6G1H9Y1_9PEZI|nr:vacuolar protein sorting-associated protein 16 [Aulographum hederae CBS 113979]
MSKPTADWDRVGDRFYRKVKLYDEVFDQELELENYLIAGAPYSGAVALYRDEDRIHTYRGAQAAKAGIDIYSCAGKLIKHINWDKGSIKGLGWSEDEKLLIVTNDGTVRCYYDLQGDFIPFTLGHGAEEHGVLSCRFWSTGFVALLGNNNLISVINYHEPRPRLLSVPPEQTVESWTLIPPADSLSRSVEVLLAIGQTIFVVEAADVQDTGLDKGPFRHIRVSPNGKFVALYTEDGKVWVVTSDFQDRLSEYDSRAKTVPKDMQWCGNNAVVLAWEDEVHLVGPNGAASKYYYDNWVHLLPDYDGLRILTNTICEFIQKVPDVTESVFRLGSTHPSSVLLDAVDQLALKSAKADEDIQLIRASLDEAVDTCVKAAGHEFSIHWQKQLLRAASFGKSVLDLYNSDEFVDMCETLRVLNAVRFFEVGMPLSYEQFIRLTPEKLITRLINRHEYLLALRISDYLRLPTDRIHVAWASQKVRVSSDNEDAICRLIVKKLQGKRGISFEEVARAAYDEGRARLATELLDYEPRAGKQVPLLLSMKEDGIALDKAIESGDTDLIYHVLLHMRKKLPQASFFRAINSRPIASSLVEASAIDKDTELLKDLYYQDDRRLDGSNLLVSEAILASSNTQSQADKLKLASKLLADSKEYTTHRTAIDEQIKLLKYQETLERELPPNPVATSGVTSPGATTDSSIWKGLSINETCFRLIRTGNSKRASKLSSDFRIPEKTFWWLRLRALVAKRDWAEIEELGKTRRSPIGWEPFFNALLAAGNPRLASTFIAKCGNVVHLQERMEMWVKCGMPVKAGEEAMKGKNLRALEELRDNMVGNSEVYRELEGMVGVMGRR